MRDPFQGKIRKKLDSHLQKGDRVILGLSGGPDSLCLFHVLMKLKNVFPLDLHVVHIDHSWREESKEEALSLEKLCEKFKVPFHLFTLDSSVKKTEESARNARHNYFLEVYEKVKATKLLLAQQADEQAETILKRVLEGSSCLFGMQEVSDIHGMSVLRPLLSVPKAEILAWLGDQNLPYFVDPTNMSSKYLRGKMRQSILPLLEELFGKSVVTNLLRLGKRALQLEDYLDLKMDAKLKNGSLDLKGFHPLEISHLNRKLDLGLSSNSVETLIDLVNQGEKSQKKVIGKKNITVSKSVLTIKK